MGSLRLSEIYIYPIKSLGGIRLEKSKFNGKGLIFDRRWMIVDSNGVCLTQRVHPEMVLFKVQIHAGNITVSFSKNGSQPDSTTFPVHLPMIGKPFQSIIWNDQVIVSEVHPDISYWFSQRLNTRCRLVSFPEENPRPIDPDHRLNNEQVSLADAYPFLLIGQSSLDDLNRRLEEPVPMNRFRPNFVFTGGEPYEEDLWRGLSIGDHKFVAVKKCARCAVPTVNQDTAVKGKEPMRTLAGYRTVGNKTFFGQNLVSQNDGEVAVGDTIIPG